MPQEPAPSESPAEGKGSFFRQSGWLMFANIAAGAFMWAVHFLSKRIPPAEYGALGALLAVILVVPLLPLQMVFAQQTAKALATGHRPQLARLIRRSLLALVLVWLVTVLVLGALHRPLIASWQLANPAGFWVTLTALLGAILLPMLWGILQGRQNFLGLGLSMILCGAGRFLAAAAIVLLLGGYAAGIMTGLLIGYALAVVYALYVTRDLWVGHGEPFNRAEVVRQILPLALGFGACQVLFTVDTMFVKAWFTGEETAFYVAAGTLARALMWVVLPLATVMFPKLVHSSATAQKSNLLGLTLLGSGVLAIGGAIGLWLVGPHIVRLVYTPAYVEPTTALLPWYAAAVVPLAMGNVLINHLLAIGDYRPVPALVLLAIGFVVALNLAHASLVQVLQVLATCNLLFLLLCVAFTWLWKRKSPLVTAAGELP
jgi:O-antigen/teichoic acid export membrane protein